MVEKLTKLLLEGHKRHLFYDHIAEFLIANDVVPVVRCKDCRFKTEPGQPNILCYHMKDDDFCSYGERKDNG